MLAKIAPKFVISRVIQNAYFAEKMTMELLKQPFGQHEDYFGVMDSQKYYVLSLYLKDFFNSNAASIALSPTKTNQTTS